MSAWDTPRAKRVMVQTPRRTAGVGEALRGVFRTDDDMPGDLADIMKRLRRMD